MVDVRRNGSTRNQFIEKILPLRQDPFTTKTFDNLDGICREPAALLGVGHQAVKRICKCGSVLGRHQNAIYAVTNNVSRSFWTIKTHNRQPTSHCLGKRHSKPFEARWEHE